MIQEPLTVPPAMGSIEHGSRSSGGEQPTPSRRRRPATIIRSFPPDPLLGIPTRTPNLCVPQLCPAPLDEQPTALPSRNVTPLPLLVRLAERRRSGSQIAFVFRLSQISVVAFWCPSEG